MKRKIVAGNWKMNLTADQSKSLVEELRTNEDKFGKGVEVYIAPPAIYLQGIADKLRHFSQIKVSAQDVNDKLGGAYTGEVAAPMLISVGVSTTILGHSERRAYFHETDEVLKHKLQTAMDAGLEVIFCVGEHLADRQAGKHFQVVSTQIRDAVFCAVNSENFSHLIIAYEPVWAIGTGQTATPDQAEEMHAHIRSLFLQQYGTSAASALPILYGGSCKPSNATEIFSQPNVDGGLIGGASLVAEDFIQITRSFA